MGSDAHMKTIEGRKKAARIKGEKDDRDGGFHLALPYVVIRSPGYRRASHTARSLLIDICNQDPRYRNGKLVVTAKALRPLGWRSEDVMRRALADLVACGLIVQTRAGSLNSPAWFAVTWRGLDWTDGLDLCATTWDQAHRGGYERPEKADRTVRPDRFQRLKTPSANATTAPSQGARNRCTAPSQGASNPPTAPSEGAISTDPGTSPAPSEGAYLERSHLRCDFAATLRAASVGTSIPARTLISRMLAARAGTVPRRHSPGYAEALALAAQRFTAQKACTPPSR